MKKSRPGWYGMNNYDDFLKTKLKAALSSGFTVNTDSLNKNLFNWQKDVVRWSLAKGKSALFEDTGLGKSIQQLAWSDEIVKHTGGSVMIYAPLSVAYQTQREGQKFGIASKVVRHQSEVKMGINIANYDILDHFDASAFQGVVLDESSILKNFSSKTKQFIIDNYKNVPYRLACTATPAPNDYMELGNHAEFLGVMKRIEMLSTFFVHDGSDTAKWRLKGHAEQKFWEWIASWACVIKTPADLGYPADGYILPELKITQHIVESKIYGDGAGQNLMFAHVAQTLNERRFARRESLIERVKKAAEIANSSDDQVLLWCDLNAESEALSKCIDKAVEVKGADTTEHKTQSILDFVLGKIKGIISKSSIYGFGINLQNCHRIIFVGLSDSFEEYYQAIRRCWRYGQKSPVEVHIITSEAEGSVKQNIERKQRDAERMIMEMVKHTKEILKSEIHHTIRISENYIALEEMIIPAWLEAA
jgi:superfamily II DNA or RNA helicase